MNTKHTKGNWTVRLNPNGNCADEPICWEGHENPATIVSGDRHIATIHQQSQSSLANARLIAAAPELLQALQECVACFEALPAREHDATSDSYLMALDAINKATN